MVRRLPIAVITKTCEILLSPPGNLLNLMLRVAARIAAGEWRGFVEDLQVRWDYESDEGRGRRVSEDSDASSGEVEGEKEEMGDGALQGKTAAVDKSSVPREGGKEDPNVGAGKEAAADDAEWSRSWGVD
jgi:hypothetical protein